MKNIRLILIGVLIMGAVVGWGQEVQPAAPEIFSDYNAIWMAISAILGSLVGGIVTWLGVRKKIDDWAEKEITKKANEKFGVDWAVVKQLVDEKKRDSAIRTKRIAVINNRGKYLELSNAIERSGFNTDDYRKFETLPEDLDINTCDLVVIDNSGEAYNEEDVVNFFNRMKDKVKLVYLATVDLTPDNFNKYRSTVKIIKLMDRLGDTIKLALT